LKWGSFTYLIKVTNLNTFFFVHLGLESLQFLSHFINFLLQFLVFGSDHFYLSFVLQFKPLHFRPAVKIAGGIRLNLLQLHNQLPVELLLAQQGPQDVFPLFQQHHFTIIKSNKVLHWLQFVVVIYFEQN
jgi:hypothetical protein